MIRGVFGLALLLVTCSAIGCGTSAKEIAPNPAEVKPDQEKINRAMEDAMKRMPQYQQQPPGSGS